MFHVSIADTFASVTREKSIRPQKILCLNICLKRGEKPSCADYNIKSEK